MEKLSAIFRIKELRDRILLTLLLLAVFILGLHIPTPGVNASALSNFFDANSNGVLGFADMFTGGALSKLTVFGLGIMPYISASIIMQLVSAVVPKFIELKKMGSEGQTVITKYTRYLTVIIAFVQAYGIAYGLSSLGASVLLYNNTFFYLLVSLVLTTGSVFLMWLGERITQLGVGNGASLIILAGIVYRLPSGAARVFQLYSTGEITPFAIFGLVFVFLFILLIVVYVEIAQRRIPVQYAKYAARGGDAGGQASFLPLKVNISGVIAIIFASSVLNFPLTVFNFMSVPSLQPVLAYFNYGTLLYDVLYGLLIIFFCFFYTSIIFNPKDVADNLYKSNGVIPGLRPGDETVSYLDGVLTRLTAFGAIYAAFIGVFPLVLFNEINLPFYFGGTTILILVSVSVDTLNRIDAYLVSDSYDDYSRRFGTGIERY